MRSTMAPSDRLDDSSDEDAPFDMDSLVQALADADSMPRCDQLEARSADPAALQSATAARKEMRREARSAKRAETRRMNRALEQHRREEKRAARAANDAPPMDEQLRYWNMTNERHARENVRRRVRKAMAIPWSDPHCQGVRVAIDLGMESLMSSGEIKSLAGQLKIGYGDVLRRASDCPEHTPLRLAFTGLSAAPLTRSKLRHLENWGIQVCEADFGVAVPALCAGPPADDGAPAGAARCPRVVVLSPDADEVLHSVRSDEVYVIGGLCDYKRIANVTVSRAEERGVRAARLPIKETFGVATVVTVLTVNQVISALMVMANSGDWELALRQALPLRKMRNAGWDLA